MELDFKSINPEDGLIFMFRIYPASDTVIHKRSYVKCQNIAANMGGIIKFLFLASYIINYYFSHTLRNVEILNIIIDKSNNDQEIININSTENKFVERKSILKTNNSDNKSSINKENNSNFNNNMTKPVLLKKAKNLNEENSSIAIVNNKLEIQNLNKDLNKMPNAHAIEIPIKIAKNNINKMHFSYLELLIMLISKVLCGCYLIKNENFRLRREAYKKNYQIIIKSLDIKNIIKSGSVYEVLDDHVQINGLYQNNSPEIKHDNMCEEKDEKSLKNKLSNNFILTKK